MPVTPSRQTARAEIDTVLDGIPLALEPAAARANAMPTGAMLARVDDRFNPLGTAAMLPSRSVDRGGAPLGGRTDGSRSQTNCLTQACEMQLGA